MKVGGFYLLLGRAKNSFAPFAPLDGSPYCQYSFYDVCPMKYTRLLRTIY